MRLPRWLVTLLLLASVVATLGITGWWWVSWPERLARQFVMLVGDGSQKAAEHLMPDVQTMLRTPGVRGGAFRVSAVKMEPRGVSDILRSRVRFRVHNVPYQFLVERGTISGTPDTWSSDPSHALTPSQWNARSNPRGVQSSRQRPVEQRP